MQLGIYHAHYTSIEREHRTCGILRRHNYIIIQLYNYVSLVGGSRRPSQRIEQAGPERSWLVWPVYIIIIIIDLCFFISYVYGVYRFLPVLCL